MYFPYFVRIEQYRSKNNRNIEKLLWLQTYECFFKSETLDSVAILFGWYCTFNKRQVFRKNQFYLSQQMSNEQFVHLSNVIHVEKWLSLKDLGYQ